MACSSASVCSGVSFRRANSPDAALAHVLREFSTMWISVSVGAILTSRGAANPPDTNIVATATIGRGNPGDLQPSRAHALAFGEVEGEGELLAALGADAAEADHRRIAAARAVRAGADGCAFAQFHPCENRGEHQKSRGPEPDAQRHAGDGRGE